MASGGLAVLSSHCKGDVSGWDVGGPPSRCVQARTDMEWTQHHPINPGGDAGPVCRRVRPTLTDTGLG